MTETNSHWQSLYKLGGWAAVIFVLYSLATMVIMVALGTPPTSAVEIFQMLEQNKLVGLLRLDILTLFIVPLYYVIFLSIFVALKKTELSFTTLGTLIAFAGVTLFLATPSVFSWLALSDKFSAAKTIMEQEQLTAAGEAILASDMWHGSGAIIGGLLMLIGALTVSIFMIKSGNFGKGTAYVGILTHGLDLLHAIISFFAPQIGVILMAIAGPLYLIWFPLLARDFFRMGRSEKG